MTSSLEDDVEVPDSPEDSLFVSSGRAGLTLGILYAQENVSDDEVTIQYLTSLDCFHNIEICITFTHPSLKARF